MISYPSYSHTHTLSFSVFFFIAQYLLCESVYGVQSENALNMTGKNHIPYNIGCISFIRISLRAIYFLVVWKIILDFSDDHWMMLLLWCIICIHGCWNEWKRCAPIHHLCASMYTLIYVIKCWINLLSRFIYIKCALSIFCALCRTDIFCVYVERWIESYAHYTHTHKQFLRHVYDDKEIWMNDFMCVIYLSEVDGFSVHHCFFNDDFLFVISNLVTAYEIKYEYSNNHTVAVWHKYSIWKFTSVTRHKTGK